MLLNEDESSSLSNKVNFKRTRKNSLLPLLKPKNQEKKEDCNINKLGNFSHIFSHYNNK